MKRVEYKYASRHLKIKGYQQIQLEFLQGNKLVQGLPRLNFQVPAHSMLRLDATQKKWWLAFDFKFKKFSIKQAFFINEIL